MSNDVGVVIQIRSSSFVDKISDICKAGKLLYPALNNILNDIVVFSSDTPNFFGDIIDQSLLKDKQHSERADYTSFSSALLNWSNYKQNIKSYLYKDLTALINIDVSVEKKYVNHATDDDKKKAKKYLRSKNWISPFPGKLDEESYKDFVKAEEIAKSFVANVVARCDKSIEDSKKKIEEIRGKNADIAYRADNVNGVKEEFQKIASFMLVKSKIQNIEVDAVTIGKIMRLNEYKERIKGHDSDMKQTMINICVLAIDVLEGLYIKMFGNEVEKILEGVRAEMRQEIVTKVLKDVGIIKNTVVQEVSVAIENIQNFDAQQSAGRS